MKCKLITVIPVYNGEEFIGQTLQSVATQVVRPNRLIVLDNCSKDRTEAIAREFKGLPCEYIRNEKNLGLFGNFNRALEFAPDTEYFHILCADDMLAPEFYQALIQELDGCDGLGLAYSLDERIDERNRHLSFSGKITGTAQEISVDAFLSRKAEIANQAMSGTLMKTNHQAAPCQFRLDMPILADVAFWADWGKHCRKIVQVNRPFCKYRWHGENMTNQIMPGLQPLVLDEWRVMQMSEQLRNGNSGFVRRFKLKGLFAVRTGIKAKRIRQQKNPGYSREILAEGKRISGPLAWYMGQAVVQARDLYVYGLLRRQKHPKNVYS